MKMPFPNFNNVKFHYDFNYVRFSDHIEEFIKENDIKIYRCLYKDESCDITVDPKGLSSYARREVPDFTRASMIRRIDYYLEHDDPEVLSMLKLMW